MKKKWIFVAAPIGIVVFTVLFGEVVMHLWNWLVPALFGWRQVTFWQALGLLVLCRILFGGLGNHSNNRSKWRQKRDERWAAMTPEEREKFRQGWRARCGGVIDPPGGTQQPASTA
jgi:hypothetical protein